MINGAHLLLYSTNADADRAFLRDVLDFKYVDVGGGWLIFRLPPGEVAVHPSEGTFAQKHGDTNMIGAVLYLMCDDVKAMVKTLQSKNVKCGAMHEEDWGVATSFQLPSGGHLGLYQPKHAVAYNL